MWPSPRRVATSWTASRAASSREVIVSTSRVGWPRVDRAAPGGAVDHPESALWASGPNGKKEPGADLDPLDHQAPGVTAPRLRDRLLSR
jgi:hypothetical protein